MPSDLFTDLSTFKISARYMWTLMRIYPLICSDAIRALPHLRLLVLVHEIFRIIYSTYFNDDLIETLTAKIDSYLITFKDLYPNTRISPKQNFLIHYPNAIRRFKPPRYFSTMRFESKHSYIKITSTATHNHINLISSIANRHQYLQVYHLLNTPYFSDIDYGPQERTKD